MYEVQIDMFSELEDYDNPSFAFSAREDAISFMNIIVTNGYTAIIRLRDEA